MKSVRTYPLKIVLIARILKKRYQDFRHYNKRNPLDELLFILCSVKRSRQVHVRAYKSLKRAYPTFEQLSQASVKLLKKRILWGGLQNHKSNAVRMLLSAVTRRFNKPTLVPLRKMSEIDCEDFLCSLPGVGKKVARCVMLYSLDMQVFPVDSNCWRIACRLGWIKKKFSSQGCSPKDMDILQSMIPSDLRLSLHVNMVSLGRDFCLTRSPKCSSCPISRYCQKII